MRLLRETHEELVLATLRVRGPLTRAQLAEQTNLSRATLSTIVQTLLTEQALTERPAAEPSAGAGSGRGRGRPVSVVSLNPVGGLALGMDLGHRRIQVTIANVAHEIVASGAVDCAERTPWARRLHLAHDLVDELTTRHDISLTALAGVGVGVIGPVPAERGVERVESVRKVVGTRFGVPVYVDNNARLAALAEAVWGAGSGVSNALYLRLSYGVGGGLVFGGRLFAGAGGAAGELGHISVDRDGPACTCGGRGCLERYVSLTTLQEQCEDILDARDQKARELLADVGARVGQVLAAACNTVNPEVVVIGGELADTGDYLFKPLRAAFRRYTHNQVQRTARITRAALGPDAAARGGIALVLTAPPQEAARP